MANFDTAISCNSLTISYGDFIAVSGLTLSIPSTGITTLLGGNGAGKSTFIAAALGLIKPRSGQLAILDQPAGSTAIKQRLGVMLQDADLPDLLTPREHLTLIASYFDRAHTAEELIERVELSEFADIRYKKLSGGQKRRVQFAAAIAGRPKLVFLDEPTTGLDTDARKVLWKTVRELSQSGTAVLLTTHYLEEADALADHTIVIDQGQVVAKGSADDIRRLVSGSIIRCQTHISLDRIRVLDGVNKVSRSGRLTEIVTNDQVMTIRSLLKEDQSLSDLTISKPSLEQAFTQLLNEPRAPQHRNRNS